MKPQEKHKSRPKGYQKDNRREPKGDHNNIEKDTKIRETQSNLNDIATKRKGNQRKQKRR